MRRRRSRSYTCLSLKESWMNVSNTFSVQTFSLTNLRHTVNCIDLFLNVSDGKDYDLGRSTRLVSCYNFDRNRKKQSHRLHTSNTLHTRPLLSTEYTVHEQFSTEMTKNTNAHTNTQTLSRPTVRRRQNKRSTASNFNSPHARRTLTTLNLLQSEHAHTCAAHVQLSSDAHVPVCYGLRLRYPVLNH